MMTVGYPGWEQHPGVLPLLAAEVCRSRRKLPCALLNHLLLGQLAGRAGKAQFDQALLLAGLGLGVLAALRADCGAAGAEAIGRRLLSLPNVVIGPEDAVLGRRLTLAPVGRQHLPLMLRHTHAFIRAVPRSFALEIATWAPPVVAASRRLDEPVPVVGNVISALLMSGLFPERLVSVAVLGGGRRHARPTMLDLAAIPPEPLANLRARYRDRMIAAAPSIDVGQLLSGLRYAMVARIRQGTGPVGVP